jgi:hypothetical protein
MTSMAPSWTSPCSLWSPKGGWEGVIQGLRYCPWKGGDQVWLLPSVVPVTRKAEAGIQELGTNLENIFQNKSNWGKQWVGGLKLHFSLQEPWSQLSNVMSLPGLGDLCAWPQQHTIP